MQNGLAFILIGFPLYLIYTGGLKTYFSFATTKLACGSSNGVASSGGGATSASTSSPYGTGTSGGAGGIIPIQVTPLPSTN